MSTYDYYSAVKTDVIEYLKENGLQDRETVYDNCFISDSVTGNASGSYYCNAYKARESVYSGNNIDILIEAIESFGDQTEDYKKALTDPEYADLTIRCYVLSQVIDDAIDAYVYDNIPIDILKAIDEMHIDDIDEIIDYITEHTA